ncbi:hypothetical protein M2271_006434 [Streptomyces sp. LBL]|nr:hypothetical protein [Streptomyces sp. LBL]
MYVDNDPVVLDYADELLRGSQKGRGQTCCVQGDVNSPETLMAKIREEDILDFGRPVALSLHALLHFVPDNGPQPYSAVRGLMNGLVPGSYLSLSHCAGDFDPEVWQAIIDMYLRRGARTQVRTRAELLRFFDHLELTEPGAVLANRWHPEISVDTGTPRRASLLGKRRGGPDVSQYAAPARAEDLSRLPRTYIDTGSAEGFRDEILIYAGRLSEAGVSVDFHMWGGGFHGFDMTVNHAAVSRAASVTREEFIRRALDR